MSDESPNALVMSPKPLVARMGRWPLYALLAVLVFLLGVLIYSVSFVHDPDRKKEEEIKKPSTSEEEKPVWLVEGSGLALDPKKDQTSGVAMPPEPAKPEPLVVVQREEKPDQQAENIRRVKTQAYMSALSAPLVAKRMTDANAAAVAVSAPGSGPAPAAGQNAVSATASAGSDNYYDPAADRDKEAFFDRARKDTSWQLQEQRTAGMPLELKTGAVIPGVMLTGVNSDLPGNMIAQVSQHVFDSATGRNLLIPQGTRIYGVYDSRIVYGQERVLIAWNRLIFPDGSSISLGAMPGADMGGMAGLNDDVNNHYMRIFGSALMMSLVSGGMAYAMDGMNDSTESRNGTRMTDEMTAALAQQLGQTTTTLLQRNLSIKPTLEIRPGYQFNIVVTKDVIFKEPYTRWRR
ncbi:MULTISPECIES: TrbI/VirB10 family protein [Desulfovibrio]|uniref:Type IV secretion system protein VirB10 n=1 Tax=Desulfovibrio desulfuricans TaxID=876 RepID=A0AA94HUT4_DESDE|nr:MULTISPECIES: TrbI/VirB10 family protein [Desulfovibrio]SFW69672.1 type IV secretion system protein VirB10 [Desulfovibrio desulfuricans]SPD35127.1 Conjugal transfer protein, TrbI [Desulfovibrio sp. G11]